MCEQCTILDEKIHHYQDVACRCSDQTMRTGLADRIGKLSVERLKLHPAIPAATSLPRIGARL